ncbi:MAG: dTDP-4-dehydrorhamnose reductase [Candidatus Nitronauta litoralis]|uniref:dTDP-4-dehydrorhamnose reductase n=1 Tax=Candidatus Nitronauta litoralis TaxID=2705533 RepID=A0A7T0BWA1_9BACT|nr:MAG: dTDP-4-dehydrorhamnose reductase [Candidatus Nitronauta litoralis]
MALPKIMLIGCKGQVGFELENLLAAKSSLSSYDLHNLDLRKFDNVRTTIREIKPNLIINAAAYTQVDKAEEEPDTARQINSEVPALLAEEAERSGAALIHYSTDYVYSGEKTSPYVEEDPTGPLGVYGATKLEGDLAIQNSQAPHLIFRTSWVYGIRGKNFLLTMMRLAKEKPELKVINDQYGAPTWCRTIAQTTVTALEKILGKSLDENIGKINGVSGIYHLTSGGQTTWFGFTQAIVDILKLEKPPALYPIPTSEYPTLAVRPKYSVLNNSKLNRTFGIPQTDWKQALTSCMSVDPES